MPYLPSNHVVYAFAPWSSRKAVRGACKAVPLLSSRGHRHLKLDIPRLKCCRKTLVAQLRSMSEIRGWGTLLSLFPRPDGRTWKSLRRWESSHNSTPSSAQYTAPSPFHIWKHMLHKVCTEDRYAVRELAFEDVIYVQELSAAPGVFQTRYQAYYHDMAL